jgi:hypothetical protein
VEEQSRKVDFCAVSSDPAIQSALTLRLPSSLWANLCAVWMENSSAARDCLWEWLWAWRILPLYLHVICVYDSMMSAMQFKFTRNIPFWTPIPSTLNVYFNCPVILLHACQNSRKIRNLVFQFFYNYCRDKYFHRKKFRR